MMNMSSKKYFDDMFMASVGSIFPNDLYLCAISRMIYKKNIFRPSAAYILDR
jgi:hypothetical protein